VSERTLADTRCNDGKAPIADKTRCHRASTSRPCPFGTRASGECRINGHGPQVGETGFGLIPRFAYTGPYEDITIKS